VVAGVLNIIVGIISLFGMFVVIGLLAAFSGGVLTLARMAELMPLWLSGMIHGVLIVVALLLAVLSSLPLIGGIYALQRKSWGLALAGSIVAILAIAPLGITSAVLVVMAKDEFESYQRF